MQHVIRKYTKVRYLSPMIKPLEDVTVNNWELTSPGDNRTRAEIKIWNKIIS